jgi:hypothetical protein
MYPVLMIHYLIPKLGPLSKLKETAVSIAKCIANGYTTKGYITGITNRDIINNDIALIGLTITISVV